MSDEGRGRSPLLVTVWPEVGRRQSSHCSPGRVSHLVGEAGRPLGACWMPETWKVLPPGLVGWQILTHRAIKVLCFKKSVY